MNEYTTLPGINNINIINLIFILQYNWSWRSLALPSSPGSPHTQWSPPPPPPPPVPALSVETQWEVGPGCYHGVTVSVSGGGGGGGGDALQCQPVVRAGRGQTGSNRSAHQQQGWAVHCTTTPLHHYTTSIQYNFRQCYTIHNTQYNTSPSLQQVTHGKLNILYISLKILYYYLKCWVKYCWLTLWPCLEVRRILFCL